MTCLLRERLCCYRTIIFDCDGVLLNSNKAKTLAFREAGLRYGEAAADSLCDFHVRHGGISRYAKFEYFLRTIVGRDPIDAEELKRLLTVYAARVKNSLLTCEMATGLDLLRHATNQARWMVVSGSDESELREVFEARGMTRWFDGGIFGSPTDKDQILAREINRGNITMPGLFFGDSAYDQDAAIRAGLDFVFVSQWSDLSVTFQVEGLAIPSLSAIFES